MTSHESLGEGKPETSELRTELEREIAERKQTEERLRASETRLRQILDLVPYMIFAKDREGRFLLVNRALAEAYQTTVEELVGKRQADVHPNQDEARQILQDDRAVIDSGRPMTISEECLVDTGGQRRFFQVTKIPYVVPETAERAVLGVAVDITELKRTEQALREAHEQLEQRVTERTAELADANEDLKREIADRKRAEEDLAYERFLLTTLLEHAPEFVYFKDARAASFASARDWRTTMDWAIQPRQSASLISISMMPSRQNSIGRTNRN